MLKDESDFNKRTSSKDGLRTICRSCDNANSKLWKQKNREHERQINKKWYQDNKKHKLAQERQRRIDKPTYWRDLERIKRKTNINFKLRQVLRSRLNHALKAGTKGGSAVRDLGCSIEELKLYLESKFYPHPLTREEMTWSNWAGNEAGWQIDHIQPFVNFDVSDPNQVKVVCHYTNLQPLWYIDHSAKSNNEHTKKD